MRTQTVRTFRVGALGLGPVERQMLQRVLGITGYRQRNYRLVDCQGADSSAADIILINVADPLAAAQLERRGSRCRPCVVLRPRNDTGTTAARPGDYQLSLPLNPTRVLKTLDELTIKEFDFIPEMRIGSEEMVESDSAAGMHLHDSLNRSLLDQTGHAVLVVDDSLAVRKQLGMCVGLHHARPVFADCGEAAVELLAQQRFSLILLDVVMPGINGYTVCKEAKKSHLNGRTPVVMLTSRSSPFDKVKGTLAGCDTYLTKPIDLQAFKYTANKYLPRNQQRQEYPTCQ